MDLTNFIPIILIFGVIYFLIVQPQMKERREHEQLLESLKRDDEVVTSTGIHGKVVSVDEGTVVLEIAEKTKVTFDKSSIARRRVDAQPAK